MSRALSNLEIADLHEDLEDVHQGLRVREAVMLIKGLPAVNVIHLAVSMPQLASTWEDTGRRERIMASGRRPLP